jgi:hypothetical protein
MVIVAILLGESVLLGKYVSWLTDPAAGNRMWNGRDSSPIE